MAIELPPFDRFSAFLSLALMRCAFWPGPALRSTAVRNRVVQQVSIWLSALRQPAHHRSAPKCHTPSPWRPPVLRQSAQRHQFAKAVQVIVESTVIHLRWFTAWRSPTGGGELGPLQKSSVTRAVRLSSACRHMCIRQNVCISRKGSSGMPRSSIQKPSKVCLCSSAVSSRTSLTLRSSRHLQAPLVGSLRASRSGAAYL